MTQFRRPRRRIDVYGHLLIDGYTYMGGNRIPPMPVHIIMTDRATGTALSLSHTGSPGSLVIDLVAPNAKWTDIAKFGPYDGPYVPGFRLYLQSGVLLAEPVLEPHGNLTVLTRRNFDRTMLDITVDEDGNIVYTEITV